MLQILPNIRAAEYPMQPDIGIFIHQYSKKIFTNLRRCGGLVRRCGGQVRRCGGLVVTSPCL